ncbi:MAG: hypothetical protein CMJ44_10280 [Pimelobacter sp.]|nr:hypothetical protein [Pimelobacter sp.]
MFQSKKLSGAALVVALLALVMSLGGTSYAAKLITGKDIKNGSVTNKDVKKSTLTGKQVKNGSLKSADLARGAGDDKLVYKKLSPTSGPSYDAAQASAPEVTLFKEGALTVYAKCFTDTSSPETYSVIYIKTSQNGAVFDSDYDDAEGGAFDDFLNTSTDEDDRELLYSSAGADDTEYYGNHSVEFSAIAPDGTALAGLLSTGAKRGTLAGGNGVYGPGDSCLVTSATWSS